MRQSPSGAALPKKEIALTTGAVTAGNTYETTSGFACKVGDLIVGNFSRFNAANAALIVKFACIADGYVTVTVCNFTGYSVTPVGSLYVQCENLSVE